MNEYISNSNDGVILRVILHPRASRTGIVGIYKGMLKIQVTAPPVDEKANDMLIEYISNFLSVSRSSVRIIIGKTSRQKILKINSNRFNQIKSKIEKLITPERPKQEKRIRDDFELL